MANSLKPFLDTMILLIQLVSVLMENCLHLEVMIKHAEFGMLIVANSLKPFLDTIILFVSVMMECCLHLEAMIKHAEYGM